MKIKNLKRLEIQIFSGLMCFLLVFTFGAVFSGKASAKPIQPDFPVVDGMQMICDGVFVSTGDYVMVNMGLVVSGHEAAVIDTGMMPVEGYDYVPNEALRVKEYIDENNLELKYIILTHRHLDHIGSLSLFESADTITYAPENTEDGQLITLGDRTFKVIRTNGHAYDQHISVELVKENILFAGDVVVTRLPTAVAFEGSFEGLIPTLEMLRTKNYSILVPGHGYIINPREAIRINLQYLKNVKRYVTKIIKDGGTLEDVLKISLEDCIKNTSFSGYLDPVDSQTAHEWNLETAYNEFLNEE